MPFLDFNDDDDPKLTPNSPGESDENASSDESGLFAQLDSTPLDDLVDGSGMVVKKGGTSKKQSRKQPDQQVPEESGLSEFESEELLRAIVGSDVPSQPAAPDSDSEGTAYEAHETPPESSIETDKQVGAEDAPTVEAPAAPSETGIRGLMKKVTSTLGISRTVKEDSPSIGESPVMPVDQKPLTGPVKRKFKDDFEASEEFALGTLTHPEDKKGQEKPPSSGPLGKRQRKTSKLDVAGMELDNPKPVEEEDWIKTVTGALLGREETSTQSPEEMETVTSRLDTLGEEPGEESQTPPSETVESQPPVNEPESPGWVSPFMGGLPSIDKSDKAVGAQSQDAHERDAEFQAFLGKLQQEGKEEPPKAPAKASTSKLDDDALLGALLSEAPQGGEEDTESLSRLSELEGGDEGPIDPAYWRISTRPLGKENQADQPPIQMSPFSMDVNSWDGRTPSASSGSTMVGGVDISAWDLPPEVQELLNKQKSGSTIQSPFDGTTMNISVDQPPQPPVNNSVFDFDLPIPDEENPADQGLLSLGMIEMPDFFSHSEEPPAANAYSPTSPLQDFDNLDFSSSDEEAPAADAYRDTSPLGHQKPSGNTQPFDLSSLEGEEAPAANAYRDTDRLGPKPTGNTEPFDIFSSEGEDAPAADAYRVTSRLGHEPPGGTQPFDIFSGEGEDAPAADAYRVTSRLGHEPPGGTQPFDMFSGEGENAPAADAYRDTSRLGKEPPGGTQPFDIFSGEGENAPAADAYRETSRLGQKPPASTRPFEFLTNEGEEAPAAGAFKETRPLMSNIEPPDPSFFFTDQPATFGEPIRQPVSPFEEKTPTTPLSRRIESPSFSETPADSDLRSMFTPAPAVSTTESVQEAPAAVAAPSIESAPKPVAVPRPPMSTRTKLLLAFGSLAVVLIFVVIVAAGVLISRSGTPATPFTGLPNQPIASNVQVAPMGLELTGGWTFYLQKGDLKNGVWTPQGDSEWLNGTELRRIVALPWNPQLEAVSQTFKTGDPVRVLMNNNDIITYRIDKVENVTRDQVDVLQGNTPALIVILYRTDSNERVVILAH